MVGSVVQIFQKSYVLNDRDDEQFDGWVSCDHFTKLPKNELMLHHFIGLMVGSVVYIFQNSYQLRECKDNNQFDVWVSWDHFNENYH